jgi:hypothetical protein
MEHLQQCGLLVDFNWAGNQTIQGPHFLDAIDRHLTDALHARGWVFPPSRQRPTNIDNLDYQHLPWTFIYYNKKTIKVDGPNGTEVERLQFIDRDPCKLEQFGPKSLHKKPFGTGSTRPKHPSVDRKPLIFISQSSFTNYLSDTYLDLFSGERPPPVRARTF